MTAKTRVMMAKTRVMTAKTRVMTGIREQMMERMTEQAAMIKSPVLNLPVREMTREAEDKGTKTIGAGKAKRGDETPVVL